MSTPKEKAKQGKLEIFESNGTTKLKKGDETCATVDENGTLHWHKPIIFENDIQSLGSRIQLWQTVLSTGDNLIQLNDRVDGNEAYEPPYAGIQVKRGDQKRPSYLLWAKDSERWEVVFDEGREKVALLTDDISEFDGTLPASRIENLPSNEVEGVGVIEVKDGKKVSSKPVTETHNFWVSNQVSLTKGTDREILPVHISALKHEDKSISQVHCRTSDGTAKVTVLKNGKRTIGPFKASSNTELYDTSLDLENGDEVSVDIDSTNKAWNLSVSFTVLTQFQ